ncbi:uncharacterized protein BHQ10_000957 [Talaromyces amestolkiae]|uniref:Tetraspanin n=1 Tax=Talaromyces amestolkiae TaxID=1196081 RepID=A0A364KN40_TALAM|nr:uncharacterized protein BHQ10_000957 [Talaromyces amestolkiae]RAO64945.1 hypothetical protein BHQ10_000957 [Talaromyces amestolkiae]
MRVDKILLSYAGANFLFMAGGIILLVGSLLFSQAVNSTPTMNSAPSILLLKMVPEKVALVNAIIVFATFLLALPSMIMRDSRLWLQLQGWLVIVSGVFTLVIGLIIWIETLRTRAALNTSWGQQTSAVQSLLQQRFDCCGYYNSTSPPFVTDATCTTPLVAAEKEGCVGPFSSFVNSTLDAIFTAIFGIVALDMILLICVAVLSKDRKEKERYRLIDAKVGLQAI